MWSIEESIHSSYTSGRPNHGPGESSRHGPGESTSQGPGESSRHGPGESTGQGPGESSHERFTRSGAGHDADIECHRTGHGSHAEYDRTREGTDTKYHRTSHAPHQKWDRSSQVASKGSVLSASRPAPRTMWSVWLGIVLSVYRMWLLRSSLWFVY